MSAAGANRRLSVTIAAALGAIAGWPAIASAHADSAVRARPVVKRFALVVGTNRPVREDLAKLRYADDDAVKWAVLLRTFGTEVELLTDLDAESQHLYATDAPPHSSPTRATVVGAMARLRAAIEAARKDGARTVFYFVYAGHGDEQDGEGYIALADGPFFRHDLEGEVFARSSADTNHAIIDACRSYYIAYDRGPGGSRRQWPAPYFATGTASRFRNTGFILASSSGGDTHEWEEFQAGIFSHEVRSGLLGGADVDGDGRITYAELTAFVRVANRAVRNERYRPDILARAPASGDDVVLDLSDAGGGLLRFGMGDRGRRVLEDSLGVRWADVHPGLHQKLTLAIPAPRWGADLFFVESVSEDAEYRLRGGAEVDLTKLAPQPRRVLRRGALHEAFALLFALPFDDTTTMPPVDLDLQRRLDGADEGTAPRSFWTHDRKRAAATGAAVGGAAGFVAAGVFAVSAASLRREAEGQNGADRSLVDDQIARRNGWTVATSVGSVLLAATAIALYGWSRSDER